MIVELLRRERIVTGNGVWYRYTGAVNGQKVGIRIPAAYVETVSEAQAETDVKEGLRDEWERQQHQDGGVRG